MAIARTAFPATIVILALNVASRVPSLLSRARYVLPVPVTPVNAHPISIFPSLCMAEAYTVLFTRGSVKEVSNPHAVFILATRVRVTHPTVVNCPPIMSLLSEGYGAVVQTVPFM